MAERTLLCATDLTQASERPLSLAVAVAKALDVSITLAYVLDTAEQSVPVADSYAEQKAEAERARNSRATVLQQKLEESRAKCEAQGVRCTTRLTYGKPWRQIIAAAEEVDAKMIVIGAHGGKGSITVNQGGLAERLLGTTADRVLRATGRPVFVSTGESPIVEGLADARWFVGSDFSSSAEAALNMTRAIVERVGGEVHVGNVVIPAGAEEKPQEERNWRQILREQSKKEAEIKLKEYVAEKAPEATPHQIVSPDEPAHALCDAATVIEADFLAVGTHGLSILGRLLVGSNAEQCLRKAPVPVLLVPGDAG